MTTALYGKCPSCEGRLTNGHKCPNKLMTTDYEKQIAEIAERVRELEAENTQLWKILEDIRMTYQMGDDSLAIMNGIISIVSAVHKPPPPLQTEEAQVAFDTKEQP